MGRRNHRSYNVTSDYTSSDSTPNSSRRTSSSKSSPRNSQRNSNRANKSSDSYEVRVMNASSPLRHNETEEITVNNVRGVYVNKRQVDEWRGELPIEHYQIHNDPNPQVIRKKLTNRVVNQVQAIKVLKPCDVKPAGDIIVEQEPDIPLPQAPLVHVVVPGGNSQAKEPLVIREIAPRPPCDIPEKVIRIPGKRLPPPPRKVIMEQMPNEPERPQDVIVERWLPYPERQRKVIFKPSATLCQQNPRNVHIIWEAGCTEVKCELKCLGIECANPFDYNSRNKNLKQPSELPDFAREFKAPEGGVWGNDKRCYNIPTLVGDVEALKLVNLEAEGLGDYRSQVDSAHSPRRN